jgi:hypothetical protein
VVEKLADQEQVLVAGRINSGDARLRRVAISR